MCLFSSLQRWFVSTYACVWLPVTSAHLPASLETLPEASVTSPPPLVPPLVPRTKALAGSRDLVTGQGLATYETSSAVCFLSVCWVYGRDGRVSLGQRLDGKLECRKPGLGRQSKVLPEHVWGRWLS